MAEDTQRSRRAVAEGGVRKKRPKRRHPDGAPSKRADGASASGPSPGDEATDGKPARKTPPPPTPGMSQKELAEQYMPYVRSIAGNVWKTLSKDIEFDDLVSYGMIGLFEAADRFDAKFGANFMTFAYYRIRGAIYDGLRGMGWVSRTEYQRSRFESRANAYLGNVNDRGSVSVGAAKKSDDDEVEELADVVGSLVTIYVTALDAMEGFQIKDEKTPAIDESLELLQSRELVKEAVSKLPEQERKLLQLYYYHEQSLEEVGKELGLSKSWTSRLHARAIEKLSRLLKDLLDEHEPGPSAAGGRGGPRGRGTQPSGSAVR
jgi:RNA polymerase sigma factor for flagellar operon FliA